MWYVYSKFIGGKRLYGKESLVGSFDDEQEAVKKVARCYNTDKVMNCLGEYYYYIICR